MTPPELAAKVKKQQGGLLLDTNVLLLYLIEKAEPNGHATWKRTSQFTAEHLNYLVLALENASRLVTTPHILAEVSNLAEKAPSPIRERFFDAFESFINEARERSPRATTIGADNCFRRLGIADLGQLVVSSFRRPLVLTVDAPLTLELEARALPVVNLNHCIEAWSA